MPLPSAEIQAFAPPTVQDGVLTLPVRINGELHGLRAPTKVWCASAREVLAAGRRKRAKNLRQAAAAGRPLRKPSGHI
jgi:hypothetical protein